MKEVEGGCRGAGCWIIGGLWTVWRGGLRIERGVLRIERGGLTIPGRGRWDGASRVGLDKLEFDGKNVVDCGGLRMEVEVGGREGVRIEVGFGEGLMMELRREGVSIPRNGGIIGLGGDMTGVVALVFVALVSVSEV